MVSEEARIDITIQIQLNGLQQFTQVTQAAQNLQKQTMALGKSVKDQGNHWDKLHAALSDIEQKYDAVFRAGFRVTQAGHDLKNIGDDILGFLSKASDAWGDYQFMLNRAAGAMDLFDSTAPLYKDLSEGIQRVARDVRVFPAKDVAQAMYFWGSTTGQVIKSQKDLNLVLDQLSPILKTAALTETDYETAVKTAYNVTKQFGLGIGSAGEVTEKMLIITQRTAAEFGDLAGSLKYVGPVAAQMKVPFDEVVKTLGLIADNGIRGTQAGRALRQMFIQTLRPSAKAKDAYNDVFESTLHVKNGFDKLIFPDGKYIGLTKHVRLLAQVTKDMTSAEQGHFLATITTANELPVLAALVNAETQSLKKGTDAIDDQKYSLIGYQQVFENMFGLLGNSWKGLLGLLTNSVQPIVLRIGAAFAEMMTPWIEALSKIVQGIDDWMKRNPKLVDFAVKVAAIAGAVFVVAGSILVVIGSLLAFYGGIVVTSLAIGAFMRIMGTFVAGWLLILGAVLAVTEVVIENADVLKGHATKIMDNFRRVIKNLGLTFKGTSEVIRDFVKLVHDNLTRVILEGAAALERFSGWLVEISKRKDVQNVVRGFVVVLGKLITVAVGLRSLFFALTGVWGATLLLAGGALLVGKFLLAFSGIPRVVALLKLLGTGLMFLWANPMIAGIALLVGAVAGLFAAYKTNFGGAADIVNGFVKTVKDAFNKNILPVFNKVGGIVQGALKPVIDLLSESLPGAISYALRVWMDVSDKIISSAEQIWDSVRDVFTHVVDIIERTVIPTLQEHLGPIWNSLVKIIGFALATAGAIISNFVRVVASEFWTIGHVIVPAAEQAIHAFLAVFEFVFPIVVATVDGALKAIVGLIDIFKGIATFNWNNIWKGMGEIVDGFVTTLKSVPAPIQGIAALLLIFATVAAAQFAFSLAVTAVQAIGFFIVKMLLMATVISSTAITMGVTFVRAVYAAMTRVIELGVIILTQMIPRFVAAAAAAVAWAATNYATLIPSIIAVGRQALITTVLTVAMWAAMLGPLALIPAAIGAVALAWITNFMGMRDAVTSLHTATQKWLDTIPGIKNLREGIFGLRGSAEDVKYLEDAWHSAGITIQDGTTRMNKAADDAGISYEEMSHKVASMMANTGNDFNRTMTLIEANIPAHTKSLTDGGTAMGAGVEEGFTLGLGDIPTQVNSVLANIPGVFDANASSFNTAAQGYANVLPTAIEASDSRALTDFKKTYSEMYTTVDNSKDQIKGIMDHFDEVLKQPQRTTKQAVGDVIADLKKLAPALDGSLGVDAKAAAQSGSEQLLGVLESLDTEAYKKYIHTAKGLPDAFKNEKVNVETEINNTKQKVIDGMQQLAQNAKLNALDAANKLPEELNKAKTTVDAKVDFYLSGAKYKFEGFKTLVAGWGAGAAKAYANGWGSWGDYLQTKISDYLQYGTRILRTASPPKEGPFHLIDKWAEGAAKVYADSFAGQGGYLKDSVSSYLSVASAQMDSQAGTLSSDFGFETTDRKEIVIKVDVTSSDGTVSDKNAQSIADAIHKGLMLDRVEHMAGL